MSHDYERTQPLRTSPPASPPPPPHAPYPPRPPRRGEAWSSGKFSPAIFLVAALVVGILVGTAWLSRRSSAAPGVAGTAIVGAAPAPGTSAAPARAYVVANTGGEGVYLRRTPNIADRDTAYRDGTRLVAIGPDVTANGEVWHNVRTPDGRTGWVPARYTADDPNR